jgi:hypothetical protein
MNKLQISLLLSLLALGCYSQDTPETAVDIIHSWSTGVFTCHSFEGKTDNPLSEAIGPDIWLKTFTNNNALEPYPVGGWCDEVWLEIEVFDENFESVPCDACGEVSFCESRGVNTSATYYISFTLVDDIVDLGVILPFGATIAGRIAPGDMDDDGLVNAEDLTPFLGQYEVVGHSMADYNMDGIVNILDLQILLQWFGNMAEPINCD